MLLSASSVVVVAAAAVAVDAVTTTPLEAAVTSSIPVVVLMAAVSDDDVDVSWWCSVESVLVLEVAIMLDWVVRFINGVVMVVVVDLSSNINGDCGGVECDMTK